MKDVMISIKGLQFFDDTNSGGVELVTDGKYKWENGVAEFEYQESELTGLEGTRTHFLVEPGQITLTREGTVQAQMVFQQYRKHFFAYDTPFGAMMMGLDTSGIRQSFDETGGELEINYAIEMDNSVMSRNKFNINVREM